MPRTCPAQKKRRRALVDQHLGLVYKQAVSLYRRLRPYVELDDLVAYGTEGLFAAAGRFDPDRGCRFSTYAVHRIRGAMIDGVRKQSSVPLGLLRARAAAGPASVKVHRDDPHAERPDSRPGPESTVELAELRGRLAGALERLPSRERRLIAAHYWGDTDLSEAGSEMGISRSWASRLHARALDQLRTELAA